MRFATSRAVIRSARRLSGRASSMRRRTPFTWEGLAPRARVAMTSVRVTMPTKEPFSTTGTWPRLCSIITRSTSSIESCGFTWTGPVCTRLRTVISSRL